MKFTRSTIEYYDNNADRFWSGTRDHDVTQNYASFLDALPKDKNLRILDFGCGPGRDLAYFKKLGHDPVGLDGSERFASMARHFAECDVWVQDFAALDLPNEDFDGIFANASLFHVPNLVIHTVLEQLFCAIRSGGALFCSNPRGNGEESYANGRYGVYYSENDWLDLGKQAGFSLIAQYYRPKGLPREQQPWFATVWRKPENSSG